MVEIILCCNEHGEHNNTFITEYHIHTQLPKLGRTARGSGESRYDNGVLKYSHQYEGMEAY